MGGNNRGGEKRREIYKPAANGRRDKKILLEGEQSGRHGGLIWQRRIVSLRQGDHAGGDREVDAAAAAISILARDQARVKTCGVDWQTRLTAAGRSVMAIVMRRILADKMRPAAVQAELYGRSESWNGKHDRRNQQHGYAKTIFHASEIACFRKKFHQRAVWRYLRRRFGAG